MNTSLDIETLGTIPGSTIVSIGAVHFDNVNLYNEFSLLVDLSHGLSDEKTVNWWMEQSESVNRQLSDSPRTDIQTSLESLVKFIGDNKVWGFGSDFDNMMVSDWCRRLEIKCWSHRQNRCLRTLAGMFDPDRKLRTHNPRPHHALFDAINQAKWIQNICKERRINL
jgi:3' exoribonuclease, RNase T-like